jgi:hypothetical protein
MSCDVVEWLYQGQSPRHIKSNSLLCPTPITEVQAPLTAILTAIKLLILQVRYLKDALLVADPILEVNSFFLRSPSLTGFSGVYVELPAASIT